ncbi:MAG: site-specific DNA-methyltransferase [Desulfurellales bacterium]|nr:MAG: site-specific DNA-methyltransferase [Desulfurellales bacterium]
MKHYYQDQLVTIYHADCREVIPTLADGSIDFVFTDPPYGHNNNNGDLAHRWEEALGHVKSGKVEAGDARPIANDGPEANELVRWFYGEAFRLLGKGCCCCCCCCGGGGPDPQFARWSLWLDESIGFKHAVVWDKGGLGMGWHYRRNYEMVLVAAKQLGRRAIAIELEERWCDKAATRLSQESLPVWNTKEARHEQTSFA